MITALTFAPLVTAILILAMPAQRARAVAMAGALVSFALTAWLLLQFDGNLTEVKVSWIEDLAIDYHVGLDGTNALVLFLAALLAPIVVWISWGHSDRPKTYFALLSLQFTGLFGTFTALNFFHWFIYWELALVPAFFLIKLFGKSEDRHKAAINFVLFTVLGSVAMLLGFLFLYQATD